MYREIDPARRIKFVNLGAGVQLLTAEQGRCGFLERNSSQRPPLAVPTANNIKLGRDFRLCPVADTRDERIISAGGPAVTSRPVPSR